MIADILNALEPEQHSQLMYAFEQGFSQIIIYKPGRFIGVNISNIRNLDLVNQEGDWSCGTVRNTTRGN